MNEVYSSCQAVSCVRLSSAVSNCRKAIPNFICTDVDHNSIIHKSQMRFFFAQVKTFFFAINVIFGEFDKLLLENLSNC